VVQNSGLKDFTRGGQTSMHAIRMFIQSLRYIIVLSLIVFAIIFASLTTFKTKPYERYVALLYLRAKAEMVIANDQTRISVKMESGRQITMSLKTFCNNRYTKLILNRFIVKMFETVKTSLYSGAVAVVLLILIFKYRGKTNRAKRDVRGSSLRTPEELTKQLKKAGEASKIKLAGVPLKKNSETQNISIIGTTGVGKTTAMVELMQQTRENKQKAIIYDKKGCFVQQFYRPDKDIILNPLDIRSPAWNVWADCKDGADFEMIAQALIPEHQSNSDPFWTSAARTIFAALCQQLKKRNMCTMSALLEPIFTDPESTDSLAKLLKGTIAETLVSEKIDKTALSIKATLSTYCKSLMFLRGLDEDDAQTFSIRNWVNNKDEDSWLFFSVVDNLKMPMLRPLISVWLDVAARSLLTLPLNRDRRIWLYYDELGSAHKLPSLEMVLSEGREYGACNVVSLLDKAQLVERYGVNNSNTILSLFNTNVLFRTNSEDTAKWMSGLLGKQEIIERRESVSMGANEIRDGVSLNDERRIEPLVLDTEFSSLPDMQAYLRLPGQWARALIKFPYRQDFGDAKVIEPRDNIDICAIQDEVASFEAAIKAQLAHKAIVEQSEQKEINNISDGKQSLEVESNALEML
jgi:type IV conjugative transfer system coupling protein TraD